MARQKHDKKARLTVTIAPDMYAKIQELAQGRRGGVSGVIEDCVRNHLDSISKTNDPLLSQKAAARKEVQQIVKEMLSPEMVSEALKILQQKSDVGEEILKSRSKRKGKTSA